jgi:hypothetical protein
LCSGHYPSAVDCAEPVAEKHHLGRSGPGAALLPELRPSPGLRGSVPWLNFEADGSLSGISDLSPVLWCNWPLRQCGYCALGLFPVAAQRHKEGKANLPRCVCGSGALLWPARPSSSRRENKRGDWHRATSLTFSSTADSPLLAESDPRRRLRCLPTCLASWWHCPVGAPFSSLAFGPCIRRRSVAI